MANELNLPLDPSRTGLTVTAVLILNNAAVGSPISCPESGTLPGHYSGDMPAVAEAVYGVRFLSAGQQVGTGVIDWDGAKERGLGDVPTTAEVWGYAGRSLDGTQATQLANLDAAISTRSTYDGSDTPGTVTLVSRLTSSRAGYLDKLNVTGTLAHSNDAATYRADVSGLLTAAAYTPPPTTADVWSYAGRTLDGTQASNIAAIASIPTNPLLTTDARLNTLDAAISTRLAALSYTEPLTILETASAVEDALTAYGAATPASVWGYTGRALDGAQATALSTIVNIPTNPLLATDSRLDTLVALAQADEVISPTQYRKLTAGTNTAILTKLVTNDGAGNIQLRAAP
jgi:hypothetical protein